MKKVESGILKNVNKFNNSKFSLGLNLENAKTLKRETNKNVKNASIKKYGQVWFKLAKGNALFKTYDGKYKPELKNVRIINELVCMELCKQIGIPHADYELAHLGKDTGLITYNFLKSNQNLIPLAEFLIPNMDLGNSLIDIMEACDFYKSLGYTINKEKIFLDVFQIMVFDALTLQSDRNNYNLNFIKNNKNHSFSVSKLFDNEFSFGVELIFDMAKEATNKKELKIQNILSEYAQSAKILNVQNEMYGDSRRYRNNLVNLCNLAKSNKKAGNILKNALKNLNINNAIKSVEALGVEITPEYKNYLSKTIHLTKSLFVNELKKPKNEDTTYIYEEFIK